MGIGRPLRRAVFLDRDGVLNEAVIQEGRPFPPADSGGMKIIPGAATALAKIKNGGLLAVVVTNQPDVARGQTSRASVEEIHGRLASALPLDGFYTCWHDDRDACLCRKPKPGLLQKAAAEHGIDLAQSFMVGDRWRDVEAGRAAGCRTIFLDHGYAEKKPKQPDFICRNLMEAADWILQRKENT